MRVRGSRYEPTQLFTGTRFAGLRPRDLSPATGAVEHVVGPGDRLDLLALQYYNDDRLWWRILDANPSLLLGGEFALGDLEGSTLVIPRARE